MIDFLKERGIIEAQTHEDLREHFTQPRKVYLGIDPTADSLHLGHLAGVMFLAFFQAFGHTPVCLIGGATAMIGDPSGKDKERPLLDPETVAHNQAGIQKVIESLLDFSNAQAQPVILNNYDWFKDFSFITFLRDVGKNFRMGSILAKESVKNRLQSEEGMSFTELSYQLLQAYDFLYLYEKMEVTLQLGGSDQWGNITAGTELIRKKSEGTVYGLTFPLLTRQDGKKFGKSEKGAIWLTEDKLSAYDFYQYLYRVPDDLVIKLLKMLTMLPNEEIVAIEEKMHAGSEGPNWAQQILAKTLTQFVHGEKGLQKALEITESFKPGKRELDVAQLKRMEDDLPSFDVNKQDFLKLTIIDLLCSTGMLESKGAARKMITNGGVSLNNKKIEDVAFELSENDILEDKLALLAVGKKKKLLLRINS